MTKLDGNNSGTRNPVEDGTDAVSALRLCLEQLTNSSIIFSAGLNPRLFNYPRNLTRLTLLHWVLENYIKVSIVLL
jgi:hypothetical protein